MTNQEATDIVTQALEGYVEDCISTMPEEIERLEEAWAKIKQELN